MTLYFVGLGIANIKDISIRGLEVIKNSDIIFLENYTNLFESSIEEIEKFIEKKIFVLNRYDLEENYKRILEIAKEKNVCILTFGEPFFATTHIFLKNEAIKNNIKVEIIHSSCSFCSIFSFGISCYKIGKIITIPLKSKISELPKSIYNYIKINKENKLHTICLLDIDVERNEFLKPKDALNFLIELEHEFKENVINEDDLVLIASKVGFKDEKVYFGKIKRLKELEIEIPSIIVLLSQLSSIEKESLELISEKYF
ncbi:MAG: diphthine synthase [Candidatus Aenigmatarchaeota archaeon]